MATRSNNSRSQPVNVRLVPESEASRANTVSADVVSHNADFKAFAERMRDTARVFIVNHGAAAEPVAFDADHATDDEANKRWLDCCLWDYLDRKKRFESRFRSRKELVAKVAAVLLVVFAALYIIWPLWEVFIDVEAESFYRVLEITSKASPTEIKKAYREQMKKWHPDRNPTCGDRCRMHAIKVQQAHDVLLQRGDQRFALANRYRDELLQLRSIVFFRVYSMAFSSAQAVFYIVKKIVHRRLSSDEEFGLGAVCKIGTLVFFTAYEVMFISGFNLFMVLQVFYYCVTIAKASAQEKALEAARKASYVDLTREAFTLLPSLTVLYTLQLVLSNERNGWGETAFQAVFGSLYVLSFLYNFTPNVYDNFLLRKCSLPIRYISPATLRFSWTAFLTSEVGFLVDDLFVFTCRVPSVYRAAVYGVHCVFLCQMCLLPWDAPVRSRHGANAAGAATTTSTQQRQATSTPPNAGASQKGALPPTDETVLARGATADEIEMLSGLDTEPSPWLDAIMIKYKRLLEALARDYVRRFGRKPDVVDLASCSDLQHVSIFALFRDTTGGDEKQKLNHLCKVKDPRFSQWLAIERGSRLMLPSNPAELKERTVQAIYKEKMGPLASMTLSDVWRRRVNTVWPTEPHARVRHVARVVALAVIFVCFLIIVTCPLSFPACIAATKEMPKAFRPLVLFRFTSLQATHILNRMAAGLLTALRNNVVLLTPDYLDSARHLQAYNFSSG